ncbi:glycoside hydrolase family 78 protein [Rhexocercosporidium sp. MPI-PUGE-AT-0058]|nr:glycoside hydrolase family 78 protein [Rhexocercosporidium sp. MPI-PUGE-AT-0058]
MKFRTRKHFLRPPTDRWLVVAMMFSLALLITFTVILSQQRSTVRAAGCWRDTACTGPKTAAFPGDWDKYNYAPTSRVVSPISYFSPGGGASSNFPGAVSLKGNNNQLIFDFGKLVGGIVTVSYGATGAGNLGMAFTEAKNWTGEASDSSNGSFNPDGAVVAAVSTTAEANFTMPDAKLRGGFRYLTLFTQTTNQVNVNIHDITVEIAFQPSWSNLRAYQGYFSCSDPLLNKIWYAGAYTLQTNAIPPKTGRQFPILGSSWSNDFDLSLGTTGGTIYVDGSKRDRTVWPGDLAIAVPSILVSTGDWEGVANTLQVLYNDQTSAGELPFAGPGINIYGSDTYHMATLIGTYDYYLWTADQGWLNTIYPKYQRAMAFITGKIDGTGLLMSQGGHNTEANMLMYKVLTSGSQLATWAGDSASSASWTTMAATLKTAVNKLNFDSAAGAFKDSDTDASVHPQDGNSLALLYSIPPSNLSLSISTALTKNWISIGSLAPELPNNLVGFGQSFEIKGHFTARQPTRALDLIRRAWGWYLNSPYGTASTCVEGYLSDGSFGYRSQYGYANDYSYTSHAHGWSTGPTDALTSFVVGLTVTAPGGREWNLAPQFGDLTEAEAGFVTPLGRFSAKWELTQGGYTVAWGAPGGTKGAVVLPGREGSAVRSLKVDGKERVIQAQEVSTGDGTVRIIVEGGEHSLEVLY